jgi:hypothetical protein
MILEFQAPASMTVTFWLSWKALEAEDWSMNAKMAIESLRVQWR